MKSNVLALFALSLLAPPSQPPTANSQSAATTTSAETQDITLAPGTSFRVRLLETLDTRRNRAGDRFTASGRGRRNSRISGYRKTSSTFTG